MAGWLAWNLRIVTGVAIALCGYYGADYWSNKDTERNIERINYQEEQGELEYEGQEIENLKLEEAKPETAKKYFENMNNASGGGVTGSEQLMQEMERRCREKPRDLIYGSDLTNRRYCRLYWHVKEKIDILIKTENKLVLLSSTNSNEDEWKAAWQEYQKGNKPWKEITEITDGQVPSQFKKLCETKANESIYDTDDKKYTEVTKYCTRKKTIKDVLDEKKIKLLDTNGNDSAWQKRFDEYKSTDIGERFRKDQTIESKEHLKNACLEVVKLATTVDNYKNIRSVAERYCKE